jgi:hypothetical protein
LHVNTKAIGEASVIGIEGIDANDSNDATGGIGSDSTVTLGDSGRLLYFALAVAHLRLNILLIFLHNIF